MVAIANAAIATAVAQLTSFSAWPHGQPSAELVGCPVGTFTPSFPASQSTLVAPASEPLKFVGLAFGVQNYTCSSSNTYTSIGALAEVIDVSCAVADPSFATIQNELFNLWNLIPVPILTIIDFLHAVNPPEILAQHYFVPNPVTGVGLSPKWDFTSSGAFKGNPDAFMIGAVKGSIPAPTNATRDITWLDVAAVRGDIASEVFRFDTVGGQPPASCVSGESPDISVKYTAKYVFYGGSITSSQR